MNDWKFQTSHLMAIMTYRTIERSSHFCFFNLRTTTHSHQMCCGNLAVIHYLGTCLKMLNKVPIMAAETKQIEALWPFACSSIPQNVTMYFILTVIIIDQEYKAQSILTEGAVCQIRKSE